MALTFNATYYFTQRPDVLNAYLASDMSVSAQQFALNHYNTFGWREGSNPNEVFDTTDYLAENADVAAAGVNPFEHYQQFGQAEGRAPNATFPSLAEFDAAAYIAANADLRAAGIDTAAEAYDHYITFGYAEGRPGAPDNADFQLVQALDNAEAAQTALADFLAEADGDNDPSTSATLADLESDLTAAETALGAFATQRAVDEALAEAQADVNAVAGLSAAIGQYEAAVAAAAAADAAAIETEAELAAAESRYETRNTETLTNAITTNASGEITGGTVSDTGGTLIVVNGDGELELNAGVTEATNPGVTALLNALNADYTADAAVIAANAVVTTEGDELDVADSGDDGATPLYDALVAAQADVDARADLVEAVEAAEALYNQGVALQDAVDASDEAFTALGYDSVDPLAGPVTITADTSAVLLYSGANAVADTITNFDSDDVLYFGEGFTVSTLADADDLDDSATDFGNASALDIFIQQVGADTVVYVETDTIQGNADGAFAGEVVTLVGVDAGTVSIDNGILRVAEPAVA